MSNKIQDYKNHRRFVPSYHYYSSILLVVTLIGSVVNLTKSISKGEDVYAASLIFCIVVILLFYFIYFRGFALRAQDRAIRAEENLRHFALTGKLLDSKLTMSQTIALRFAPDEEFVELAKKTVTENLKANDIKKAIKNWKADNHRV